MLTTMDRNEALKLAVAGVESPQSEDLKRKRDLVCCSIGTLLLKNVNFYLRSQTYLFHTYSLQVASYQHQKKSELIMTGYLSHFL